jgi:Tfp pilus assembly protein PilN
MNKVEFNLLPDLKMEVVKGQRSRRTIVSIAFLLSAAAMAVFLLLLLTVYVVQKKQLSDANKEVVTVNNQLKNIKGLDKILTVQNQLETLTGLHETKRLSSRLFAYLPQVTPTNVSIGNLTVDLTANTLQIGGTASSQHAVNTFIDTLKFTTYSDGSGGGDKNAFPVVVESSFSITGSTVNYVLDINYDPVLFANKQPAPTLKVPTLTSTRSVVDNPSNQLFTGQAPKPAEQ